MEAKDVIDSIKFYREHWNKEYKKLHPNEYMIGVNKGFTFALDTLEKEIERITILNAFIKKEAAAEEIIDTTKSEQTQKDVHPKTGEALLNFIIDENLVIVDPRILKPEYGHGVLIWAEQTVEKLDAWINNEKD